MQAQGVELLVDQVPAGNDDVMEIVTALRVGGRIIDIPEGSDVTVHYQAGTSLATVRCEIIATVVRFVPDPRRPARRSDRGRARGPDVLEQRHRPEPDEVT